MSFDLSAVPDNKRKLAAENVRTAKDIVLPILDYLNSAPCDKHEELDVSCRACGIQLRKHQRIAVAWLYLAKHGLLGDIVGSGKTHSITGLVALLRQFNEIRPDRVMVICRPAALEQWEDEIKRAVPDLKVITATGTKQKRIAKYVGEWDVVLTGFQMLSRDLENMLEFNFSLVVIDDVDTLRHKTNQSAYVIKRLARESSRVVITNATPLHKKLLELYSVLEPVGGHAAFGTERQYKRDFINRDDGSYKNLDVLKSRLAPLVLRRTTAQLDDISMPAVVPSNVFLELYPAQREKYTELAQGVLKIIREESETVKKVQAVAKWTYGSQICSGLATLGEEDLPRTSSKLDWVEDKLTGDLSDEKVVVFATFKNCVKALAERLYRNNIGFEIIWGNNNKSGVRAKSRERFWSDPDCKVLIGTTAITSSLNLQVSRHLINVDQIMNQALMTQLSGRIRRVGSSYETVYVHNLLTTQTQEANYLELLSKEQALFNVTFDDHINLYPPLSPTQMLELIRG